jgi:hypothetical protein
MLAVGHTELKDTHFLRAWKNDCVRSLMNNGDYVIVERPAASVENLLLSSGNNGVTKAKRTSATRAVITFESEPVDNYLRFAQAPHFTAIKLMSSTYCRRYLPFFFFE